MGVLRTAISNEVHCYMYTDKHIIAGIINSSNPVKAESVDQFYSSFIKPTKC